MKKTKLIAHLRWLMLLTIYFCVLAIVLVMSKNDTHRKAVEAKQTEMALTISEELGYIDLSITRAMSYVEASSKALSFYAMEYNKNQITLLIKNMVESTSLTEAYVCDTAGTGYDNQGKEVSLSGEQYFGEIVAEYSRGGSGMVRPDADGTDGDKEVILVSHVTFDKKEEGFLIAKLPIEPLSDKIFMDKYLVDEAAVVTLDGKIISRTVRNAEEDNDNITVFWDLLPNGISRDTIKLNISQKSDYLAEVPGYGYVLVLPLQAAGGGAVALVTYEQMKLMTTDEAQLFMALVGRMIAMSLILVVMIFMSNIISDKIQERIKKKRLSGIEMDPATGLLTRASAELQIKSHIDNPDTTGGLLFLIGIEGVKKDTELDIKIADARRHAFAKALKDKFRATDILARAGDDKYIVFLKGIRTDKDVRKQTDEMQMFLHDMELSNDSEESYARAGAALYPDNGRTAKELMDSAKEAYERSKETGVGRLSF